MTASMERDGHKLRGWINKLFKKYSDQLNILVHWFLADILRIIFRKFKQKLLTCHLSFKTCKVHGYTAMINLYTHGISLQLIGH